MSAHDRLIRQDAGGAEDGLDPARATRHRGDRYDFLARHQRQVKALRQGRVGLDDIGPFLLCRLSDARFLRVAWDHLHMNGGQAPGPDRCRYTGFTDAEIWGLCRALGHQIRTGDYGPARERIVWVPKGPGRGRRPLVMQSIFDRVVQRATLEVIQPILDPLFRPFSFGYRPRRSPLHALALAARLLLCQCRDVWVTVDVRDAFGSIPLPRLLDILRKYLVADDLVEFIGAVISLSQLPGLRQGRCLSPLLLNLYLHHLLDRVWRRPHPDVALIRYADDILLLCRSVIEARSGYNSLANVLRPAGLLLKGKREPAIRRLSRDEPADWLGFRLEMARDDLRVDLTDDAWWSLEEKLALAHEEPDLPARALRAICGWVASKGPCYPDLDEGAVYAQIAALASQQGFDRIPNRTHLHGLWQRAWAQWSQVLGKS